MKQYMTLKQMAQKLDISARTLYRHQRKPGFPRIKIGRAVRYDPDAVLAWYAENYPDTRIYDTKEDTENAK
jgi:Predicted transcriptional regulator